MFRTVTGCQGLGGTLSLLKRLPFSMFLFPLNCRIDGDALFVNNGGSFDGQNGGAFSNENGGTATYDLCFDWLNATIACKSRSRFRS